MTSLVRGVGRDLRVDFFRGIALYCIFLDHVPGDTLARFAIRNVTLNDATEIFILLAGYAAALVYGPRLDRARPLSAGADVLTTSLDALYRAYFPVHFVCRRNNCGGNPAGAAELPLRSQP